MDAQTKSLITDLRKFLQEVKQDKPDLEWCSSYETMRKKLRELRLYQFCPAYFEGMLRLVRERAENEKRVPDYVLQVIRTWYNKARGYDPTSLSGVYVEPNLEVLLGEHYEAVADHLLAIFSRWITDEKKGKIVRGFITGLRFPDAGQIWLTENWMEHEVILQRLLMYPDASDIISTWTAEKALNDGALLHRLPDLVARMLDADPDYLLTVKHVVGMMEQMRTFWHHLDEYYEAEIKSLVNSDANAKPSRNASKSFVDEDGMIKLGENAIDWLEQRRIMHPLQSYGLQFFAITAKMQLQFCLKPNIYHAKYLGISHFFELRKDDLMAFCIQDMSFDSMGFPEQTQQSVRNFYLAFPYIDIDATLHEWKQAARRIRDNAFYRGIFQSRLPQARKNELYKHYFTPALQFFLSYFIKKEKNAEMAEWLIERVGKY